ncbi:hypothetical protein [Peribacillus glennii]|uniref:Uncharacterized protein n=1 Tax=Peribacillus glennii TaxID=2303991 RepID=A0A372LI86_9BACI|nr:hypothetical protein [Peribacillus glennii]RFU65704.1 hypothetical protein D0466_07480 [Peribacillus glennii]
MIRSLVRMSMMGGAVYLGFRYRYRLLNTALSNSILRKLFVKSSMNMPGVREKMVQGMFKPE